jgi:hypothetical protein
VETANSPGWNTQKKRTTDYVDKSLGYQIRKSGDLKDEMAEYEYEVWRGWLVFDRE